MSQTQLAVACIANSLVWGQANEGWLESTLESQTLTAAAHALIFNYFYRYEVHGSPNCQLFLKRKVQEYPARPLQMRF